MTLQDVDLYGTNFRPEVVGLYERQAEVIATVIKS